MKSSLPPSSPAPDLSTPLDRSGVLPPPPTMKLAFHIGARGTLFSKAICKFTGSPYSHVELVLTGPNTQGWGYCFSADEQDGGTRFKPIQLDPSDWVIVDLPYSCFAEDAIWLYAESKNNLRYDWLGILGFVFPWGEHDDSDRFCSEIVAEVLEYAYGWNLGRPWMVSPGELYEEVKKYV